MSHAMWTWGDGASTAPPIGRGVPTLTLGLYVLAWSHLQRPDSEPNYPISAEHTGQHKLF